MIQLDYVFKINTITRVTCQWNIHERLCVHMPCITAWLTMPTLCWLCLLHVHVGLKMLFIAAELYLRSASLIVWYFRYLP